MDSEVNKAASKLDPKTMNPDKLHEYLTAHADQLNLSPDAGSFSVAPIIGGYSNLTYGVNFGGRAWVLRRPPYGANIKSGHDMEREYSILAGLAPIYAKVPRPLVYCDDSEIIGAPFYLMERVDGVILRGQPGEADSFTPPMMTFLANNLIDNLATIHGLDYASTPLVKMARPGSYIERQIKGWLDRYEKSKTDDLPNLDRAGRWLAEHAPAQDSAACLIHNDYKYDNVILSGDDLTQIAAVLDWEMATIGDPLMDVGTALAYWIEPNDPDEIRNLRPPTTLWPGNPDRAGLLQRYAQASGRDIGDPVFYYVYGLYKLAVIAQQIYSRFKSGYSTDQRFAVLILHIRAIANLAARAIDKNRISELG